MQRFFYLTYYFKYLGLSVHVILLLLNTQCLKEMTGQLIERFLSLYQPQFGLPTIALCNSERKYHSAIVFRGKFTYLRRHVKSVGFFIDYDLKSSPCKSPRCVSYIVLILFRRQKISSRRIYAEAQDMSVIAVKGFVNRLIVLTDCCPGCDRGRMVRHSRKKLYIFIYIFIRRCGKIGSKRVRLLNHRKSTVE